MPDETTIDLPNLPEIFNSLRSGYHFSQSDGEIFGQLRDRFDEYQAYFRALGLELVKHPRGFVYLESDRTELQASEKRLATMLVFAFILIEALGDRGESVSAWVFSGLKNLSDLPHFETQDRYKNYLRDLSVRNPAEMRANCLKPLERIGMVAFENETQFRFKAPFQRFIDVCLELGGELETAPAAAELEPEDGEE